LDSVENPQPRYELSNSYQHSPSPDRPSKETHTVLANILACQYRASLELALSLSLPGNSKMCIGCLWVWRGIVWEPVGEIGSWARAHTLSDLCVKLSGLSFVYDCVIGLACSGEDTARTKMRRIG